MADDLSTFRRDWLKELKEEDPKLKRDATPDKNEADGAHQPTVSSDRHSVQGNVGVAQNHGRGSDVAEQDLIAQEPVDRLHGDDLGLQVQQICENPTDLSTTYYPFRILTSLLNRASTEEGPKPRRVKRARSDGNSSTSDQQASAPKAKRTYFSVTDLNETESKTTAKLEEKQSHDREEKKGVKDYLDLFIADLDDINEIPFFDTSLAREVAVKIFWHLDVVDLCRAAQVSRSWRSLAEDELLWCRLCQRLGFEKDKVTVEHCDWKSRVRQYSVVKRSLENNWKNRTGRLHNLHHAKGGVLCAVHSHSSTVVAGYSNCQTKLWDVFSGETVIFQPSSTALLIDERQEEGTISNEVLHVVTCKQVTAASYQHGFVDVWSNEEGTEPVYTFTCDAAGRTPSSSSPPSSLQVFEQPHRAHLAVSTGPYVQLHTVRGGGDHPGRLKEKVAFEAVVKKTKFLQPVDQATASSLTPTLAVATNYSVSVLALHDREVGSSFDMSELHNIIDAPVTCLDTRTDPAEVVVGFTLNTGPQQFFRRICFLCVNIADSPASQLVTGSRDRKVRVYDTRVAQSAVMTLIGHTAALTSVQMDDGKVVSEDEAGFVRVWDPRSARKLWEMNNRHPVGYCRFEDRELVVGHIPYVKQHDSWADYDTGLHQRHRGSLHVYDFLADQMRHGVPEICLSSFDEPQGYNYNITLAVPYDQV